MVDTTTAALSVTPTGQKPQHHDASGVLLQSGTFPSPSPPFLLFFQYPLWWLTLPSILPRPAAFVHEITGLSWAAPVQTPAHHYRQGCISQLAHGQTTEYKEASPELGSPQFYTSIFVWASDKLILKMRILCVCIFPSGTSKRDNQHINGIIFKRNCKGCNRPDNKKSLNSVLLIFVCILLRPSHSSWKPENTHMQVTRNTVNMQKGGNKASWKRTNYN